MSFSLDTWILFSLFFFFCRLYAEEPSLFLLIELVFLFPLSVFLRLIVS